MLRESLLNGKIFVHIDEMRYGVTHRRMGYSYYRPRSSLWYMIPVELTQLGRDFCCVRPKRSPYKDILNASPGNGQRGRRPLTVRGKRRFGKQRQLNISVDSMS